MTEELKSLVGSIAGSEGKKSISLRMSRSTAAAVSVGLAQAADQPGTTRRAGDFFTALSLLINDALEMEEAETRLPLNGEEVVLEHYEDKQSPLMANVPTVFSGHWFYKPQALQDGVHFRKEIRLVAPAVWQLCHKAAAEHCAMPAGSTDWLVTAPLESEATFETPQMKVTFNVARDHRHLEGA